MPRAPFNTTCDIFDGPGGPVPNAFIGACPCRLVINDDIDVIGPGAPVIFGWVTMDAITPKGAFVLPYLTIDPSRAYQIAVPSGTFPQWWILFIEEITYGIQPTYIRCEIVALPLPPISPGGTTCPTALPTTTAIANSVLGQLPSEEYWWKIPIPAGTWTLTFTTSDASTEITLYSGDCSTLTVVNQLLGTGASLFVIPAGPTLDYLVKLRYFGGATSDSTWDVS